MQVKVRDFFYLSNLLSISRIFIVMPMAYLMYINTYSGNILLVLLAIIGAASDVLDGYASRKLNQVTELGIILDPICDKIAMAIIFIALIIFRNFPIPLIVLFIYRDLVILISGSALIKTTGNPMMANLWGKINTAIFTIIAMLYILELQQYIIVDITIGLGYLTLAISTISYGIRGLQLITNSNRVRFLVWVAVLSPLIPIFYLLRDFSYF